MSSDSDNDFDELLTQARAFAVNKRDDLAGQEEIVRFDQETRAKPVAEAPVASTSRLPSLPDKFGKMPMRRLSKKAYKKLQPHTAGGDWFEMPAAPADPSPELKREISALKLSGAIDPKRFLRGEARKDAGKLPEFFQVSLPPSS
jgi:hypothetical protein